MRTAPGNLPRATRGHDHALALQPQSTGLDNSSRASVMLVSVVVLSRPSPVRMPEPSSSSSRASRMCSVPMTNVVIALNLSGEGAVSDYKKLLQGLIWSERGHARDLAGFLLANGLLTP